MTVSKKHEKFLRMKKAGIPLAAIQNAARLQGYDMEELNEALGVERIGKNDEVKEKKDDTEEKKMLVMSGVGLGMFATVSAMCNRSDHDHDI